MKQRFVTIWFPYLITDLISIRQPHLKTVALVVCAPSKGKVVITAVNSVAEKEGIGIGMALADARAIQPSLISLPDKPGLQAKVLKRVAEWAIRFTPFAAVDPLGGVIVNASGCSHLWGGDAAYVAAIVKRIEEKGFHVKAAMADTIGTAWAVTRFSTSSVIPPGKEMAAIQLFPPESLRIEAETTERLHKLGLHRVKDLLEMPQGALTRRFGDNLVKRIKQATGTEQELIEPVNPTEPFTERLPCLEPVGRREGIEIALRNLLEVLCKRLILKGKGIRNVAFKAYRIDGKEVSISIGTSTASTNTEHLFKLFLIKIATLEPDPGIELFIVEATRIEDYKSKQEKIWNQGCELKDYRIAEWMDRVSEKVGSNVVYRYLPEEHHWPERSVKKVVSLGERPETSWLTAKPRPLRLLPAPQLIEVTAPIPDYPPMMFRYKGKLHKIIKADGPERIEQEWWIQNGQHRDYYAVQDEEGSRYWVFRSGYYDVEKTYTWYLHGFFA